MSSIRLSTVCGLTLAAIVFSGALATSALAGPLIPSLAADFDEDGDVDSVDLAVWNINKYADGASHFQGDANGNGLVDVDDLLIWKQQEGSLALALPALVADEPHLQYNRSTGSLSIAAQGFPIFAFNVTQLSASLTGVSNAELPGAWDVQSFNGTVQAFDASILGEPTPVVSDFPLSSLGGAAAIANLPAGLQALTGVLHYGLTDDSTGLSPLIVIVPEPAMRGMLLVAALVVIFARRQ